jgi:hypothetical protein
MSLRSFIQKIPKYSNYSIFFLLFLFNMVYLFFKENKTSFDYFFIIFSIGGLVVEGVSIFFKLTSRRK